MESHAVSTVENATESAHIMREIGVRNTVVATSADHLDRVVNDFVTLAQPWQDPHT